jgi:hypothetical protein
MTASVNVRFASPDDRGALERLAQLDSTTPPRMAALLAEVDGELVAALPLRAGKAVADPFRTSGDLVQMLELRVAQLSGRARSRRRASPRLPAHHQTSSN